MFASPFLRYNGKRKKRQYWPFLFARGGPGKESLRAGMRKEGDGFSSETQKEGGRKKRLCSILPEKAAIFRGVGERRGRNLIVIPSPSR